MDEELYRRLSMPPGEQGARYAAGIWQFGKTQKYYWSDGSFTWCASCGQCVASEAHPDGRWVIHHAAVPLDGLLAKHLAEVHNLPAAAPPQIPYVTWSTGVGYVRAACQQCGWEKDAHQSSGHADLFLAAERHASTTHLPSGGRCSAEGCDCDDHF